MDSLQLRVGGFFVSFGFFVERFSSPRILPVCYAAFCLLLIYVFTYRKKKIGGGAALAEFCKAFS